MEATIYKLQRTWEMDNYGVEEVPLCIMADWELAKIVNSGNQDFSDYEFVKEYPHLNEMFTDKWTEEEEVNDIWEETIEYKGWKFTSVDGVYIEDVRVYISKIVNQKNQTK